MTTTVEDLRSIDHACAVPVSDEQLWEMAAAFLAHGLASGEQVVYFDDGASAAVLDRMADDGVDVARPMSEGRFTVLPPDVSRSLLRGRVADLADVVATTIDRAIAQGYPGVRMTGRPGYLLARPDDASLSDYDRVLDDVVRRGRVRVLCLYDRNHYPEDVVETVRALHRTEVVAPAIYDDGLLRITATGPGAARVAGEVDHSNHGRIRKHLESALDGALRSLDSPTDITLDVTTLRFLDVASAVNLVHAAEQFPDAHRLVITGVRPHVQRVLDRCGAPFAPQLVVHPRGGAPQFHGAEIR
jgi:anti-anti-sigma regulatory factor